MDGSTNNFRVKGQTVSTLKAIHACNNVFRACLLILSPYKRLLLARGTLVFPKLFNDTKVYQKFRKNADNHEKTTLFLLRHPPLHGHGAVDSLKKPDNKTNRILKVKNLLLPSTHLCKLHTI